MFHACFIPIATCFASTLYHFYTFFGTNLLTRCRSASSCFLLFLYSRKASLEIFSELDENLRRPLFYQKTPGVRRRGEVEPRGPHTWARRGQGPTGAEGWCRLLVHRLATPFGLYIAPTPKTLKQSTISPEEFRSSAATKNPNSGDRSLCFGTLPGRGIAPGAISINSIAIFIAAADSHDEEGVVLPRG